MGLGTEISRTKASYVMEASLLHHPRAKEQRAETSFNSVIEIAARPSLAARSSRSIQPGCWMLSFCSLRCPTT